MLIGNMRFLDVDVDRMTHFMEGIGSGYIIIIIIKEHFLKTIRTGPDKCALQNHFFFLVVVKAVTLCYSRLLRSTVGSQEFLPTLYNL